MTLFDHARKQLNYAIFYCHTGLKIDSTLFLD